MRVIHGYVRLQITDCKMRVATIPLTRPFVKVNRYECSFIKSKG